MPSKSFVAAEVALLVFVGVVIASALIMHGVHDAQKQLAAPRRWLTLAVDMPPSVEGWSCDGWTCGGGSLTWDLVDSEQVSHGYSAGDDERQYLRREVPLGE